MWMIERGFKIDDGSTRLVAEGYLADGASREAVSAAKCGLLAGKVPRSQWNLRTSVY